MPDVLSKTNAFADTARLKPAAGMLAYDVNVPFWSDGAVKRRWIALPGREPFDKPNERIGFSPADAFAFPAGTVFIKHFDLSLDEKRPELSRRLETRVLMRGNHGGLYGATYRWRADGHDADRVDEETTEEITVVSGDAVGPLEGADVGAAPIAGIFHNVDRGCDIASSGAGAADAADALSFAATNTSGDFDVRVRLASLDAMRAAAGAGAGLMFRQTNDPGSPMAGVLARPDPHAAGKVQLVIVQRQADRTPMQESAVGAADLAHDIWLRLQRRDQWTFTALTSGDGINWTPLAAGARSYYRLTGRVGVFASGGNAAFRDLAWMRRQSWYYPSSFDCLSCHNQNAGMILGVNARQLNRDFTDPATGAAGNQLVTWWRLGMFAHDVSAEQVAASPRLTPMTDAGASLQDRARSYLDVNCAYCHRPGGAGGYFDASLSTPFEKQNLLTDQLRNSMGINHARIIAASDPNRSVLLRRIRSLRPSEKMPPLGRNRADADDVRLVEQWIQSMPATP
jgi:hypothetical protein